jgi:CDGSH-type Zn-finger protein/uncharacterized Fe-S cluster protein YjdI
VSDKKLVYRAQAIEVSYDVGRCIHAAECVRSLPQVFDPKAKPWINPEAADADAVATAIHRCPTGALHYERRDQGEAESPDPENLVSLAVNGPLYLRGRVHVLEAAGKLLLEDTRVALCRCGASKSKPFCDNSHQKSGFEHDGTVADPDQVSNELPGGDVLQVTCTNNGPFGLRGPFRLVDGFAETVCSGDGAYLCRCGHSANKPFCDGSHKRVGFQSA